MSTVLTRRADRARGSASEARRLHAPLRAADGGSTLEQVVSGVWEDLSVRGLGACLVCGDDIGAYGPAPRTVTCRRCGSELS